MDFADVSDSDGIVDLGTINLNGEIDLTVIEGSLGQCRFR